MKTSDNQRNMLKCQKRSRVLIIANWCIKCWPWHPHGERYQGSTTKNVLLAVRSSATCIVQCCKESAASKANLRLWASSCRNSYSTAVSCHGLQYRQRGGFCTLIKPYESADSKSSSIWAPNHCGVSNTFKSKSVHTASVAHFSSLQQLGQCYRFFERVCKVSIAKLHLPLCISLAWSLSRKRTKLQVRLEGHGSHATEGPQNAGAARGRQNCAEKDGLMQTHGCFPGQGQG